MRQRLFIFGTVAAVLLVLAALSAARYTQPEREPDTEWNPDRSTYNAGATGTRALYDFLNDSGYQVMRWRESPKKLTAPDVKQPATFVVVGETQEPLDDEERDALLQWVKAGGRLVLVDRRPAWALLPEAGGWQVVPEYQKFPTRDARPSNPDEMTAGVALARVAQPTLLTRRVASVMPSRFASHLKLIPQDETATDYKKPVPAPTATKPNNANETEESTVTDETNDEPELDETSEEILDEEPPPPPAPAHGRKPLPTPTPAQKSTSEDAPVAHLVDYQGVLLVDYKHGKGRIVVLSDPFIIANGGLKRADNLHLAINLMTERGGLIAFDEFHQGHSARENKLLAYFGETPIVPLLAQGGFLLLLFAWARGRRWARPLPVARVDRRSQLEFVASMAELQQGARAYDLALENIYTRTRRSLIRFAGVGNDVSNAVLAQQLAARSGLAADTLQKLFDECADHLAGEPLTARRALELATQLRELEARLGLQSRAYDARK